MERVAKKMQLTPQGEAILNAVMKFGSVHVNQLDYVMPEVKTIREAYSRNIADWLINKRVIRMKEDTLIKTTMEEPEKEMVDSLWVAIDLFKEKQDTAKAFKTAHRPDESRTLSIYIDDFIRYDMIPLFTSSDFMRIDKENERISGTEDDSGLVIEYLLVIRDLDVLKELRNTSPNRAYKIAYLEGEYGIKPQITYYEIE